MEELRLGKKIFFTIITFFISVFLVLFLAELTVRILSPQYRVPRFVESAPWGIRKNISHVKAIHQSPEYAYQYNTNSAGFRGTDEYSIKRPDGVIRIMVQGDSVTLGHGVQDEETYPALLQKRLREKEIHAEVINMGVSGFGTAEELIQFQNDGLVGSEKVYFDKALP
ncbi:MAG: hypothetical protein GX147_05925 [Deltaproteobacteria bacterium]|jgi:hypothetical protein|nr:hypothetical protein [Deltaproteobacteria bacterium]